MDVWSEQMGVRSAPYARREASLSPTAEMQVMYAVILSIVVNLQSFPLFVLPDGQPVYMRTTTFRVVLGQFPTKADCLAYDYTGAEFVFSYTDSAQNPQSVVYPLSTLTYTFAGCAKVL